MANETETAGLSAIAKETKIGLFFPCYVDAFFPQVGIATLELLEKLGCSVEYPLEQTCCGQPIANSGCQEDSAATEAHFVECFKDFDSALAHTPRSCSTTTGTRGASIARCPRPYRKRSASGIAKQEGKMNAREVILASVRRNLPEPPVPLPNAPTVAVHGNLPDEQRSTYNFLSTFRGSHYVTPRTETVE